MCLKINVKSAIKNAFSFALDAKRISIMFLTTLLIGLSLFFSIMGLISYFSIANISAVSVGAGIVAYSILFIAVILLASILLLLIKGLFIHNYTIRGAEGNIRKSAEALNGRILSLISLTILVLLISSFLNILNIIPLLGTIANIIFAFAVFFAYQEVMLQKSGAIDAIKNSYNIFRASWKDTLVSFAVIFVIMAVIDLVFAIPLTWVFVSSIMALSVAESTTFVPALVSAITNNLGLYIISGAIFVIGLSISNLFTTGFTTDVYLQLKGKKPVIEKAEKPKRTAAKKPALAKMPIKKKRIRKRKKAQSAPISENVSSAPQVSGSAAVE
ncbi:Uncharacterised protein [uncultured archaeon]|nr:Uncharacterised protein [uncultured archaeon]